MMNLPGAALIGVMVMSSGCADSTSPLVGELQQKVLIMQNNAPTACPSFVLKIAQGKAMVDQAVRLDNDTLLTISVDAITLLATVCAEEAKSCGGRIVEPMKIGMSKDQVLCSLWGNPDKKNTTETTDHVQEQWIYQKDTDINKGYLYFDNGVLTAIQKTS